MAEAILIPYMSIGLLFAVMIFVLGGKRQANMTDYNLDHITRRAHIRIMSRTLPLWLRFQVTRFISALVAVIGWPLLVPTFIGGFMSGYRGTQGLSHRERGARVRLASLHINASVTVTLFAAFLLLLRVNSAKGWLIDLSCYLVLISFATRLAYNSLQGTDLPSLMKQNLLHPYLQFGLVALIDYLGLLLAAVTLNWRDGGALSIPVLVSEAKSIAAFSHVAQIFRHVPNSLDAIMIVLGAITLAATIIGHATRFKQFKRTPKDHARIIMDLLTAGKRSAAMARLAKLNDAERGDSSMLIPRTLLAIGTGEFDRAYNLSEADYINNSESKSLKYSSRTPDDIFVHMISLTFAVGKFTDEEYRAVIGYAVRRGISDGCLCQILMDFGDFGAFATTDEMHDAGIVEEKYPLAHSAYTTILSSSDYATPTEVLQDLVAALSPLRLTAATDQIVHEVFVTIHKVRLGILDEETLARLLTHLEQVPTIPGWLAQHCYMGLMQVIQARPAHGHPLLPRVQAQLARILANSDTEDNRRLQALAQEAFLRFSDLVGTPDIARA